VGLSDDRDAQTVNVDDRPVAPGVLEAHPVDDRDHVDPVGGDADLIDDPLGLKVGLSQPVARGSKGIEGVQHLACVLRRGPYPDIQILGRAGEPVHGHGIATHDQELNVRVDECGQQIAEVGIQHQRHP
jgi:hypothetical protein